MRRLSVTVLALFLATPALAGVTRERRPEIFCEFSSTAAPIDPAKVRITVDGTDVSAAAKISSWRVSYRPSDDMAPGVHHVTVVVEDTGGHRREKAWSFTIDPSAGDVQPPHLAFQAPSPAPGSVLAEGPVEVVVEADDGDGAGVDPATFQLSLSRDGGPAENVTTQASATRPGRLAYRPTKLDGGTYLFRAQAADRVGNRAPETFLSFGVDATPPAVRTISAAPDTLVVAPWRPASAVLSVEVADEPFGEVASVEIVLLGPIGRVRTLSTRDVRGTAVVSWDGRTDAGEFAIPGTYKIVATARDYAGREASGEGAIRVVVPPAPAPDGADPASAPGSATPANFPLSLDRIVDALRNVDRLDLSGRTRPGAEVEIFVNGRFSESAIADSAGAFRADGVRLEEGRNRLQLRATDLLTGETAGPIRADVSVNLDTRSPGSPEITEPADGGVVEFAAGRVTVGGDAEPGARVVVTIDGRAAGEAVAGPAGRFRIASVDLAVGDNTISAAAVDVAGNRSLPSRAVRIRRLPDDAPEAPVIDQPADGATIDAASVTVEGSVRGVVRVVVLVDGVSRGESFSNRAGRFRVQVSVDAGRHELRAKAVTISGQESAPSTPVRVTRGAP